MKKISLSLLLLVQLLPVFAQKSRLRIADEHYEAYRYALASKEYEQLAGKDTANLLVKEKLALCYRKLNDAEKEEQYLASLCQADKTEASYFKWYAEVLAKNGKYAESVRWYRKYAAFYPEDDVSAMVEAYSDMNRFYRHAAFYKVRAVDFNSPQADFSPAFYQNGLVFCSSRATDGKKYPWDNSAYIKLYVTDLSAAVPAPLSKSLNSPMHEGPLTFSSGYDTMFFTRNSSADASIIKLKICYAVRQHGVWGKAQDFELNNKAYSIGHPALASDGKLYFVSDMPGGLGGTDLYYTRKENGQWIAPVNLGPGINTAGNELFPFLSEQGDLYFASNGRTGMGGLDIFEAKAKGQGFTAPANMGSPVNSSKDDFGLIIRNNEGYFSSNRGAHYGDDNLYAFSVNKSKPLVIAAYDRSQRRLENFTLTLKPQAAASTEQIKVSGSYAYVFDCEQDYNLAGIKQGYLEAGMKLTGEQLIHVRDTLKLVLEALPTDKKLMVDLVSATYEKLVGGTVTLKNTGSGKTEQIEVRENMPVSFVVSQEQQYELTGTKKGYKRNTLMLMPAQLAAHDEKNPLPLMLTADNSLFALVAVGQTIEMDIKYDVGKTTIRPDAAKALDQLLLFLQDNPAVKVELGSHTDVRGSDEANFKLSQKRAESAVNYLVAKGVAMNRLIPVGYGEQHLKVASASTEAEHQENRRTTVKIVSIE